MINLQECFSQQKVLLKQQELQREINETEIWMISNECSTKQSHLNHYREKYSEIKNL